MSKCTYVVVDLKPWMDSILATANVEMSYGVKSSNPAPAIPLSPYSCCGFQSDKREMTGPDIRWLEKELLQYIRTTKVYYLGSFSRTARGVHGGNGNNGQKQELKT